MRNIDALTAQAVVTTARQWVGTPYGHQGRLMGARVDCVGLILCVGWDLNILDVTAEEWAEFEAYSRTPNPRKMGEAMEKFLVPLDVAKDETPPDGAIGWFGWREEMPMHLAIMASFEGRKTMIHAFEHVSRCVEHGFVQEWPDRVSSWWAYPKAVAEESPSDDPRSIPHLDSD